MTERGIRQETSKARGQGAVVHNGSVRLKESQARTEERFRDALWPESGKPASLRRHAFFLAILYALIYAGCFLLLFRPLNGLTARMPPPLSDVVRALLPSAAGTALCAVTWPLFPEERRTMLTAYGRLARWILVLFAAAQALVWGEWAAQRMILRFAVMFALGPLLVGGGAALALFYWDWMYGGEAEDEENHEDGDA